jgi:hypothetical protein
VRLEKISRGIFEDADAVLKFAMTRLRVSEKSFIGARPFPFF